VAELTPDSREPKRESGKAQTIGIEKGTIGKERRKNPESSYQN